LEPGKIRTNFCMTRPRVCLLTTTNWTRVLFREDTALHKKYGVSDPLPPLLAASPYRARASRAAVPLCKGDNKPILPLEKGESRVSGRGSLTPYLWFAAFCVIVAALPVLAQIQREALSKGS